MKEAVEYFQQRYSEENHRFEYFETKCSKMLTFVTLIVAGLTALGGHTFPIQELNLLGFSILIFFLLSSFFVASSWFASFSALKIDSCPVAPRSSDIISYCEEVDVDTFLRFVCDSYSDCIAEMAKVIDVKSAKLESAYFDIFIGAMMFLLTAFLILMKEVL